MKEKEYNKTEEKPRDEKTEVRSEQQILDSLAQKLSPQDFMNFMKMVNKSKMKTKIFNSKKIRNRKKNKIARESRRINRR